MSAYPVAPLRSRLSSRVRPSSPVGGYRPQSVSPKEFIPKPVSPIPPGCICERPKKTIFCRSCGWTLEMARVRMDCPVHPKTFYLLDLELCPRCRAYPPLLYEIP